MTTPNQTVTPTQDRRRIIMYVLIGLLIASNAVVIYMLLNKNKEIKQQAATIEETNSNLEATKVKLDSIGNQLNLKIEEVKKLGQDVSGLEQIKAELEKDKASLVADGKSKTFTMQKYQDKITQYEAMLTKKDDEIKKLKGINEELLTETTTLKTKQNQLADSISGISQEKKKLQEQVNIASALKAESLIIHAISDKGKERDSKDAEFKARNVDKIKVEFRLAENKLTRIEGKTILMRVVEPNGVSISDASSGGGTFKYDDKELSYTQKQDILFDNSHQSISFIFKKSSGNYSVGKHTVEFYCEGFKIGQGGFTIK